MSINSFWLYFLKKLARSWRLLVLLASMLLGQFLFAQKSYDFEKGFRRFQVEDGLTENSIRCLENDHFGFLWVGTKFGLNRFDGRDFVPFNMGDESDVLPNDIVNDLYFDDASKTLWVATVKGLVELDLSKNPAGSQVITKHLEDVAISKIFFVDQDRLMLSTLYPDDPKRIKLLAYNPQTKVGQPEILEEKKGLQFIVDPQQPQYCWFTSLTHLKRYNLESKKVDASWLLESDPEDSRWEERFILDEQHRRMLISRKGGKLWEFDLEKQELVSDHTFSQDYFITTVADLGDGSMALGTANHGLLHYWPASQQLIEIRANDQQYSSLLNDKLYTLKRDGSGGLWVGTDNGLCYYDPKDHLFGHFEFTLPSSSTAPILQLAYWTNQSSEILSAGSFGRGVAFANPKQDSVILKDLFYEGEAESNFTRGVRGKDERVFLANFFRIYRFSGGHSFDLAVNLKDFPGLENEYISSFSISDEGHFLVATYAQKILCFSSTGKRLLWQHDFPFSKVGFFEVVAGQDGIWVSHGIKLYHSPDGNGKFEERSAHFLGADAEVVQELIWLEKAPDGSYTIIFDKNSVVNYDPKTGNSKRVFPQKKGKYQVFQALKDAHGSFFFYTNRGLVKVKATGERESYNSLDGLPYHVDFHARMMRDISGHIFLSSESGVTWFHEDSLTKSGSPPHLLLSTFSMREIAKDPFLSYKEASYQLTPDQNAFSFEVSTPQFGRANQSLFFYRMSGLEEDWTSMGKGNYGSFSQIPGGDYSLEVEARDPFTKEVEARLEVPMSIAIPYYASWWFWALIGLLVSLLIYALFRYRIKEIKRTSALETNFEKQLAEVEMRALRAQMNPHFLFNCLNSIKFFIIKNEPERAADYLTKFSRLIRLILNNSKSEMVNLKDELEALGLYIEMEKLRFEKAFDWKLEVEQGLDPSHLEIPPLILQPYVENAIWHGLLHKDSPGMLEIEVKREGEMLLAIIHDNGVGRQRAAELKSKSSTKNKSLGMQITKDRIAAINDIYKTEAKASILDLVDPEGQPIGTEVRISIPI